MATAVFVVEAMVRGYHVYREIWDATVGEELDCQRETANVLDTFAVAVIKGSVTVGHVPRKISCICSVFLRRGGSIRCRVIGLRRYSSDLPQGGLEVPCQLIFEGMEKEVLKVKKLAPSALKSEVKSEVKLKEMKHEVKSPEVKFEATA